MNYYFFHDGLNTLIQGGFDKVEIYTLLNKGEINPHWIEVLGDSGLHSFNDSFTTPAVGASGAIYGLLVAFTFMFPNA